jgi:hypothetical protein
MIGQTAGKTFTSVDPDIGIRRVVASKIKDIWPETRLYKKQRQMAKFGEQTG